MSETVEQQREEIVAEPGADDKATTTEARVEELHVMQTPPRKNRNVVVPVISAITAILALALLFWWYVSTGRNGAGRPVPAPRAITLGQTEAPAPADTPATGPTIELAPEQVQRAGLKIETVGEQLSTEGGGGVATGTVQPNSYRETPVTALVGGIVRSVGAELGQSVKRGQTMAVVFSNELSEAQSRYLSTLAELDEHHQHHKRVMKLVEIGAASREEMEQAVSKLKTAEAELGAQRQKLLLLGLTSQRISELRSPSQITSEVSLPAPISGTVVNRAVNPGEVVEANKEILRVADLSSVWVIGQVYEKDLGKIRTGSGASITTDAYPNRIFRGRISYVDPRLDPQTRTAQVRIELANPGQMLKIGMYVNLAFATIGGSETTTPVVPVAAVQSFNNQQVVFVATNNPNVFAMRPVRLGPEVNGRLPVLEGLNAGDRVVTDGSFMLRAEWLKMHPTKQ